jgi:hypothetical protein
MYTPRPPFANLFPGRFSEHFRFFQLASKRLTFPATQMVLHTLFTCEKPPVRIPPSPPFANSFPGRFSEHLACHSHIKPPVCILSHFFGSQAPRLQTIDPPPIRFGQKKKWPWVMFLINYGVGGGKYTHERSQTRKVKMFGKASWGFRSPAWIRSSNSVPEFAHLRTCDPVRKAFGSSL